MPDTSTVDFCVVGAGIVGLATAIHLRKRFEDALILVVEKEKEVAVHQTGNNSGVIHSGVYYQPGSLKAENCKRGYQLLLEFLIRHEIPHELCGKIILATNEPETDLLANILKRGQENGLQDLQLIDEQQIREIEPHARGVQAIHVPQAGITDYKLVARKMQHELEQQGVKFLFNERVRDIQATSRGVTVRTSNHRVETGRLIACGGLYSDRLAKMTVAEPGYKIVPFRGEYYNLKPEACSLVKGLIYPVPDPSFPFLGVHFTKTIHGGVESGPNAVFAFGREGYRKRDIRVAELFESMTYKGFLSLARQHWRAGFHEMYRSFSKTAFVRALQKLIPEIKPSDVIRGGAGVRAQALKPDGSMVDDFLILQSENIINVCNAPSPAATASLAIGEHVATLVEKSSPKTSVLQSAYQSPNNH